MKTEPDAVPDANGEAHKGFIITFEEQQIFELDRRFYMMHYSILIFIFVNSLGSLRETEGNSIILIIGISFSLCASIFSIVIILLEQYKSSKRRTKITLFGILHLITGLVIIITDPQVVSFYSNTHSSLTSTSGVLLFPYSMIGCKYLLKSKIVYYCLTYAVLTLAFILSWKSDFILTHILIYLILSIYVYSLSFEIREVPEIVDVMISEEVSSFKVNIPSTPLEEILSEIHNGIEKILDISKSTPPAIQKIYRKIIGLLKDIMSKIQNSENIYHPRFDLITKNMDEEEKIFIKQECFDKNFTEMNKFKRRQSEQRVIQRKPIEYGVSELSGLLKQIGKEWNFDLFFVEKCSNTPALIVGKYTIKMYELDQLLNINEEVIEEFLNQLERRYPENPYHNSTHAADVMCSFMYFLNKSQLSDFMTSLEWLSGIVASLGHDVGHPGKNNRFLVLTLNEIAIQYNDISVLEMMHASIIFQILAVPNCNIFGSLPPEKFTYVRKLIIDMILATDMSKHFDVITYMKTKYFQSCDFQNKETRCDLFRLCLKSADVGHTSKNIDLHEKWCFLVIEEFFNQGDEEKARGLPISMYCDRENTNIPKSQMGFIKNIVMSLFTTLNTILESEDIEKVCIFQLKQNEKYWENLGKQRNLSSYQKPKENKQDENIFPLLRRPTLRKGSLPPIYKPAGKY